MPFSFKPTQTPGGSPLAPVSGGSPLASALPPRELEGGSSVLRIVLMAILILSVLMVISLLGYRYYLQSQIDAKKAQLAEWESKLGALPLEDFRKLSNRLKVTNKIIKDHPSVNVVFRILEDSVEDKITYKQFDLSSNQATGGFELKLGAIATSYHAVINQVNTLKQKPYTTYIPSVVVDNVHPNDSGYITFSLKMPIIIRGILPEGVNLLKEGEMDAQTTNLSSSTNQTQGQPVNIIGGLPQNP